MRLDLLALFALCVSTAAGRHVRLERQDTATSSALSTSTLSATSAAPESSQDVSSVTSIPSQSAAASSSTPSSESPQPTSKPSTISLVPGTPPTLSTAAPASNQTTTGDPVPLPIIPKLTPAVGLAGAILMITGVVYGLVGVRNKWLYTFFGVAYLVSLAVLVLILYCMNPPVSDGVQGAYFVGVSLTGALCGGVALVFRDLADGFGCLLGGFCVAMWFLTLKAGGTIPSTVGRAVFIGVLTIAVGFLGLHSRTRKWGLIGSIPFSGATATILGIDCFSRAGMKEFWIYLWNLNDNEFPLDTNTYPLTRGMKVEIAGIVLLFLLGLISQIKLSKVLKERQEMLKQKLERRRNRTTMEQATVDRQITSISDNEQGQRKSVYGGKSVSTLTVVPSSETVDKQGFVVRERHMSDLEMAHIQPMTTRGTIKDQTDEIQQTPYLEVQRKRMSTTDRSRMSRTSLISNERAEDRQSKSRSNRDSLAPPAPDVIPLPFKIPGIEVNGARSHTSLSAIEEDYLAQRKSVKRTSSESWRRFSARASTADATASREELMSKESDNASSVAATFDELDDDQMSLSTVTLPRSPIDDDGFSPPSPRLSNRASFAASLRDGETLSHIDAAFVGGIPGKTAADSELHSTAAAKRDSVAPTAPSESNLGLVTSIARSESSDAVQGLARPPSNGLRLNSPIASKRSSAHSDVNKPTTSNSNTDETGRLKIVVPQGPSQPLTQEFLAEQLADGASRITMQYRTNEWAKHLESAQEPEEDSMTLPPSPGVQVDTIFRDELGHTPLSPVVDPDQRTAPKSAAKRSSTDPTAHRRKKSRSEALAKLTSPVPEAALGQRHNSQRNISSPQHSRPSSSTMPWPGPARRLSRNVSSPEFASAIVELPTEADAENPRRGLKKRTSTSRTPTTEGTLIAQRESRLESKPKSQSFAQSTPNLALTLATPTPSIHGKTGPSRASSSQGPSPSDLNGRVSQLRHSSSNRQGSTTPKPAIPQEAAHFDSHQPQRRTSALMAASQQRRGDLLTDWRESLREGQNPQKSANQQTDDTQMQRLLQEKRLRQAAREQEKLAKTQKEERISSKMMKGGNLVDAHRLAMKNMQASVKH